MSTDHQTRKRCREEEYASTSASPYASTSANPYASTSASPYASTSANPPANNDSFERGLSSTRRDSHTTRLDRSVEPDRSTYSITNRYRRSVKSLNASEDVYVVEFKKKYHGQKLTDLKPLLHQMFSELIDTLKNGRTDRDRGRLYIGHKDFFKPIVVHLRTLDTLTPEAILEKLGAILQSEEQMVLDTGLEIKAGVLESLAGGGCSKRMKVTNLNKGSMEHSMRLKQSVIQIPYDVNNMCAAMSLVLCEAHKKKENTKASKTAWSVLTDKRNFKRTTPRSLKNQAIALQEKTSLPLYQRVHVEDLHHFEKVMDAQIVVLSRGNEIIYPGRENTVKYFMYFETVAKHYTPILSVAGFLGRSYFCEICMKPYNDKTTHRCCDICKLCKDFNCRPESPMCCRTCNRECRSMECFERHKKIQPMKKKKKAGEHEDGESQEEMSICMSEMRCRECLSTVDLTKRSFGDHKCCEYYCHHCMQFFTETHNCYIQTVKPKRTAGVFYFYDCETRFDTAAMCKEGYSAEPHADCDECDDDKPCRAHAKCTNCHKSTCSMPEHIVNLVVCQSQCDKCTDKPITENCDGCGTRCKRCDKFKNKSERKFAKPACRDTCGKREMIFTTIEEFGEFLFKPYHAGGIVLAHNGGRFDEYFVLKYALNNGMKPDKIIYAGGRIMMMHMQGDLNIKFLDSLAFLPMALRRLPKAFSLKEEKGEFPYFFNTKEHETYCGKFPSPAMYGVDSMMTSDRVKFLEWYAQQDGKLFDMHEEIRKYCIADVTILREACIKFRNLMFDITKDEYYEGLDVFSCTTIASVCMNLFRGKFLQQEYKVETTEEGDDGEKIKRSHNIIEKGGRIVTDTGESLIGRTCSSKSNITSSLARIPAGGYAQHHGFSKVCIEWLTWEEKKRQKKQRDFKIQHAMNTGEVRIKVKDTTYKVDGYYSNGETKYVFEFNGCRFHGCHCIKDRTIRHPYNNKNMEQLLALTQKKEKNLKEAGYEVISIWECQWKSKVEKKPEIQKVVSELELYERLNPRDAFFGGRTCPFKLSVEAAPDEKIQYVDFTSLYPWVNKYCQYPVGHPKLITKPNKDDFDTYFGIAKIDITPPPRLLYGVLPVRIGGKLMFPLCRTCAENMVDAECKCTREERTLTGTWCTPEIQAAIHKGTAMFSHLLYS